MKTTIRPIRFWQEFRESIYHDKLPPDQEREVSLGFYAGMLATFTEMSRISGEAKDDDAGAKEMERLRQEIGIAAFSTNLRKHEGGKS